MSLSTGTEEVLTSVVLALCVSFSHRFGEETGVGVLSEIKLDVSGTFRQLMCAAISRCDSLPQVFRDSVLMISAGLLDALRLSIKDLVDAIRGKNHASWMIVHTIGDPLDEFGETTL